MHIILNTFQNIGKLEGNAIMIQRTKTKILLADQNNFPQVTIVSF